MKLALSHYERNTGYRHFTKEGAEEDILALERGSNRRMQKNSL
jgi:hypothetical protein